MNQAAIISINPSAKTLGVLKAEAGISVNRLPKQALKAVTPGVKETLNILTGIDPHTGRRYSGCLLILRAVTAAVLITAAVLLSMSIGTASITDLAAWGIVDTSAVAMMSAGLAIWGVSLIFGLFSRVMSAVAFVCAVVMAAVGMITPVAAINIGFPALVFVVFGPGIYSADQCIRRAFLKGCARK